MKLYTMSTNFRIPREVRVNFYLIFLKTSISFVFNVFFKYIQMFRTKIRQKKFIHKLTRVFKNEIELDKLKMNTNVCFCTIKFFHVLKTVLISL